jgi:hypothetical protein
MWLREHNELDEEMLMVTGHEYEYDLFLSSRLRCSSCMIRQLTIP